MTEPTIEDDDEGCWQHGMESITERIEPAERVVQHCDICDKDAAWSWRPGVDAIDAYLASPEAAQELAAALGAWMLDRGGDPEQGADRREYYDKWAQSILAAWRTAREGATVRGVDQVITPLGDPEE